VSRLLVWLTNYVERVTLEARVYISPADISWGRDDVTVQPDVFVVPREMARASWRENSWTLIRHLLLAIEVLSPSTRHADRFTKRHLYQRQGVPLYWIVDPESQTAEVWTPEAHFPTIERERLVWHPEGAAEPFVCPLAELFAEP
jgi:Uma2 family endonuclease